MHPGSQELFVAVCFLIVVRFISDKTSSQIVSSILSAAHAMNCKALLFLLCRLIPDSVAALLAASSTDPPDGSEQSVLLQMLRRNQLGEQGDITHMEVQKLQWTTHSLADGDIELGVGDALAQRDFTAEEKEALDGQSQVCPKMTDGPNQRLGSHPQSVAKRLRTQTGAGRQGAPGGQSMSYITKK